MPDLVCSQWSLDDKNTQQFPVLMLFWPLQHLISCPKANSNQWTDSHQLLWILDQVFWCQKSAKYFLQEQICVLTEVASNPTQSSKQNGGRQDTFLKKQQERKDMNKKVLWFSMLFSFQLLQILNVLSQFSAPSEGIHPRFKRYKDLQDTGCQS